MRYSKMLAYTAPSVFSERYPTTQKKKQKTKMKHRTSLAREVDYYCSCNVVSSFSILHFSFCFSLCVLDSALVQGRKNVLRFFFPSLTCCVLNVRAAQLLCSVTLIAHAHLFLLFLFFRFLLLHTNEMRRDAGTIARIPFDTYIYKGLKMNATQQVRCLFF